MTPLAGINEHCGNCVCVLCCGRILPLHNWPISENVSLFRVKKLASERKLLFGDTRDREREREREDDTSSVREERRRKERSKRALPTTKKCCHRRETTSNTYISLFFPSSCPSTHNCSARVALFYTVWWCISMYILAHVGTSVCVHAYVLARLRTSREGSS
jgi:hypothetical protein